MSQGAVYVCGGLRNATKIRHPVRWCPRCKRRRRMRAWFEEWYGWTMVCEASYKGRNGVTYRCRASWGSG